MTNLANAPWRQVSGSTKTPAKPTRCPLKFQGATANILNNANVWFCDNFVFEVPGRRTEIYSDKTGILRRIRCVYQNLKPAYVVAEVLSDSGKDFVEYARPSFEWAKRQGLYVGDL